MTLTLEGRTALLVGANGRIGHAIAHALGDAGASLILAARHDGQLLQLRDELDVRGVKSSSVTTDITDDAAIRALLDLAASEGFEVAINNAGVTHQPARLGNLAIDEIDRVLAVSMRGIFVAMRSELNTIPDGGSIVNVVSTAGISAVAGMGAYVAAKHAVVGLTRTAALDYAERGIRVNAVAPGSIDSGGISAQPHELKRQIGFGAPLARLGHAHEVASAVAWLASPASSYTTGAVLTVDGGKGARGA